MYTLPGAKYYEGFWLDNEWSSGTWYYDNANKRYEGDFTSGHRYHGYGISYYRNGSVEYKGMWNHGMKQGKGTLYDETGNLIHDGLWQSDEPAGKL